MMKIGVIGCGNISPAYLEISKRMHGIEIVACADRIHERAEAKAAEFGIRAVTVDHLLADEEISVVLNLTDPVEHAGIMLRGIDAGKHVYGEKPLAVDLENGREILQRAGEMGVRVGCAPDTFLGAGYQTVRSLLEEGAIGRPTSFTAFMLSAGVETWHPNPFFFYDKGAGPMFDMGPYYLTALVHLFGPVRRVCGVTSKALEERVITSQPYSGEVAPVRVPTHVQCLLEMASGVVGTLITSFDVQAHTLPNIQVYGTEATLICPDPNTFGGPIKISKGEDWEEVQLSFPNAENSRSIGLADMADAIEMGREHRASGELACHVLEVMHAAHESAESGQYVEIRGGVQPSRMPLDLGEGEVG
ncbi:MAG: Gfo/Idh/MocA family protein [Fimbriimonadaceae bacterium]